MGLFDRMKRIKKENLLNYLQTRISDKSSLEDIINVFEEMCGIPIKNDMILFETGTFDFTGEPMFYFSLVRQFPNSDDEYNQIHVDVLYIPLEENKNFKQAIWNEEIEENIFNYIRESKEFNLCKEMEFSKVDIYMDET